MKKYYLKKFIPVYQLNDLLCIGLPADKHYIEVPLVSEYLKKIEKIIVEGCSVNELKADPFFNEFFEKKLLTTLHENVSSSEINRNAVYLQYILGRDLTQEEKGTKILIFGLGGAGSVLCYQLAQHGFYNMAVVDFDSVGKSDVSKTLVYDQAHQEMLKIEALKKRIKENFNIELQTANLNLNEYEELNDYILTCEPDIVVKACDPSSHFMTHINTICFQKRIPLMVISYSFERVNIGPLLVPGATSCIRSFEKKVVETHGEKWGPQRKYQRLFTDQLVHPSATGNINILGSFATKELLYFISRNFDKCKTLGQRVVINVESLEQGYIPLNCEDDCPVCSEMKV